MAAIAASRATSSQLVVIAVSRTSAASWKVRPATSQRPRRSQTSRSWWPSRDENIVHKPRKNASIAPTTMRISASQSIASTATLDAPLSVHARADLVHRRQRLIEGEGVRLLDRREVLEGRRPLGRRILRPVDHRDVVDVPFPIRVRRPVGALERVGAEIVDLRNPEPGKGLSPDQQRALASLLHERDLPVVIAHAEHVAI